MPEAVVLHTDCWFWVLAVIGPVLMIMVPLLWNVAALVVLRRRVDMLILRTEALLATDADE
jgi:hypothetical protein